MVHRDVVRLRIDGHDPFKRVLLRFARCLVTQQSEHLIVPLRQIVAGKHELARRHLVKDATACRAYDLAGFIRRCVPGRSRREFHTTTRRSTTSRTLSADHAAPVVAHLASERPCRTPTPVRASISMRAKSRCVPCQRNGDLRADIGGRLIRAHCSLVHHVHHAARAR